MSKLGAPRYLLVEYRDPSNLVQRDGICPRAFAGLHVSVNNGRDAIRSHDVGYILTPNDFGMLRLSLKWMAPSKFQAKEQTGAKKSKSYDDA